MLTDVHADGSLDKTIVLETDDTSRNMLGIDRAHGWEADQVSLKNPEGAEGAKSDNWKYKVTLKKHFPSAAAANAELAVPNDTLFRVTSTFEKRFRWFYTYLYYADTYHAVNRLDYPIGDYLTREDYAFIDRLPAEGKPISRADSLYLSGLHDKIYDQYGGRAYLEMYYSMARELLTKNGVASAWLDTLRKHKAHLYDRVRGSNDVDEDFMVEVMDSLGIPLPADADRQFARLIKPVERLISFVSTANDGKYQHAIHMPADVIRTNADSVAGSSAFWRPPVIRFIVKDYTMYTEARQLNYWAVALSIGLIGFTGYLLWRGSSLRSTDHGPR
jgi:hypothetical protein